MCAPSPELRRTTADSWQLAADMKIVHMAIDSSPFVLCLEEDPRLIGQMPKASNQSVRLLP